MHMFRSDLICIDLHVNICMHVDAYVDIHKYLIVFSHESVPVCIHIYVYIYVCIYVYTYLYVGLCI